MIPSDRFLLDGNHAWWVLMPIDKLQLAADEADADRPCDACDGDRFWFDVDGEEYNCEDCRCSGRHTFDVEVEGGVACGVCGLSHASSLAMPDGNHPWTPYRTYRVSIVPGMVLPIRDRDDRSPTPLAFINESGNAYLYDPAERINLPIFLPPAAAPGMWAVKLRVAS